MKVDDQVAQSLLPVLLPKTSAPAEQKGEKQKIENPKLEGKVEFDKTELYGGIEKLNKTLQIYNKHLKFSIHEATRRVMVQVINNDTGEVIREIPPKKILDMLAKIQELDGLLVDERV